MLLQALFYWSVIGLIAYECAAHDVEVCERERFEASCEANHVILMTSARFGRMRKMRCVNQFGTIGCQKDVLPQLDSLCSGLQSCSFAVSDLHSTNICPPELISYLEASYDCIESAGCEESTCQPSSYLRTAPTSGIISSTITREHGCGSSRCPWILEAEPGQSFNFTLFHFTKPLNDNSYGLSNSGTLSRNCHRVALIKEVHSPEPENGESVVKEVTICSDEPRMRSFTIHKHSSLQVVVLTPALMNEPRFILSYQVYGCPTKEGPPGSSVRREGNTLTIKCDSSDKAWHLTCANDAWVGRYGSCYTDGNKKDGDIGGGELYSTDDSASRSALLVVICIGLIIGVLFGICLLALVMYYYKSRHSKRQGGITRRQHNAPPTPDYHRCEKHGQIYSESPYQCTHTLPSHYTLSRPDLCMQGFRPVPEGDAMTSDGCSQESGDVISNNLVNKIKCYEQERTNLLNNERSTGNTLCSSFKPHANDRESTSRL